MPRRKQVAKQPGSYAVALLDTGIEFAQQVAHLGSGHFALELGTPEHGTDEAVLVEQHAFVEGHVGDPNGAFLAQSGVVARDRDFVHGTRLVGVQAAVAVVVADRIGRAQVRDPAGFEQRKEPCLVLPGNRHRTRDGQRERTAHPDGAVQNLVDAPQVGAPEGRQAMGEKFIEGSAFIDAPDPHPAAPWRALMVHIHWHHSDHNRSAPHASGARVNLKG